MNCCNVTVNFCFNTTVYQSCQNKKRKGHAFKAQWSVDYFIKFNGNALCLLYNDTIAVLKKYNICWHYQTKLSSQYFQLKGKQQLEILEHLQCISLQQKSFTNIESKNEFLGVYFLANQWKSFNNDELIKSCLTAGAKGVCLEKANLFKTISLSARTVAPKVEDIGSIITSQKPGK